MKRIQKATVKQPDRLHAPRPVLVAFVPDIGRELPICSDLLPC